MDVCLIIFVNMPCCLDGVFGLYWSFLKKLSNRIPAVILLLAEVPSLGKNGSALEVGVNNPGLYVLRYNYFWISESIESIPQDFLSVLNLFSSFLFSSATKYPKLNDFEICGVLSF